MKSRMEDGQNQVHFSLNRKQKYLTKLKVLNKIKIKRKINIQTKNSDLVLRCSSIVEHCTSMPNALGLLYTNCGWERERARQKG